MVYLFIWCLGWSVTARASYVADKYDQHAGWIHVVGSFFVWPIVLGNLLGDN